VTVPSYRFRIPGLSGRPGAGKDRDASSMRSLSAGRTKAATALFKKSPMAVSHALLACSLLPVLLLSACSKVTLLRTEELRRVQDKVDSVGNRVETLQKSVDDVNLAMGGSTSKMKADLTLMLNELSTQITRLHSEIDETQHRLTQLTAKIDRLDQRKIVGGPVSGEPAGQGGAAAGGTAGGEMRVVEGLDLENLYNQSRDDYIRGKYDLAFSGFKSVYEKDAGGTWKEQAMYWMGECLLKQEKPDKALEAYQRTVQEFPRGTKTCSARFKIGLILHEKKDKARRDEEWNRLVTECPGHNEAQRARELMKE
jgi:TolA-binding protein